MVKGTVFQGKNHNMLDVRQVAGYRKINRRIRVGIVKIGPANGPVNFLRERDLI